jgi:hypothetical protein
MTRAAIAREANATRAQVTQVLTKKEVTRQKVNKAPQPTIKLADPTRTAANIRAKMGAEYLTDSAGA